MEIGKKNGQVPGCETRKIVAISNSVLLLPCISGSYNFEDVKIFLKECCKLILLEGSCEVPNTAEMVDSWTLSKNMLSAFRWHHLWLSRWVRWRACNVQACGTWNSFFDDKFHAYTLIKLVISTVWQATTSFLKRTYRLVPEYEFTIIEILHEKFVIIFRKTTTIFFFQIAHIP